ncbi:aldehyde dehydrogenase [Xylona heveae TC161]|uniref:Aldehyde dehydrogenase n=1 Tax=Xylona heveae (strain CBS 132557 / TC161) TaxID=1328760 RepID=A0A165I7I1_XYLHT|nr:aldehyde dehydrogenase [Xylona heveae TC161]KZF24495.1 aldehyde dehydrogenase [Xylona heveae TC161]
MIDRISSSVNAVPLLINGQEISTKTTFEVKNPSTQKLVSYSCSAGEVEAVKAVEAAQAAFPDWARTRAVKRRDIVLRAAAILESRADELAKYMQDEVGATKFFSEKINIGVSAEIIRDVAGRIAAIQGSLPSTLDESTTALVSREPYGVVLGIAPWNAPYILGFRAAVFALAAGNTVVLKGSENTPRCFWAIGKVFADAGLPKGCLNVLYHRPQDAAAITEVLIKHPFVKKVNFTGSTAVGRIIAEMAGKSLKPVLLELGGKASAIVLKSADLKKAAKECVLGSFLNSGQTCMCTERIIVEASIEKEFGDHLKAALNEMFPHDQPPQVLVNSAAVNKVRQLVDSALDQGANLLFGKIEEIETSSAQMRPLVLQNVTNQMDIFYIESFGPTVSVIAAKDEAEAVAIANDTEYGLSAAVFTEDLATGLRVAKQIESGAVHINAMTFHDEPSLPHGGIKSSGYGRFNADWGLNEFLKTKTITFQN